MASGRCTLLSAIDHSLTDDLQVPHHPDLNEFIGVEHLAAGVLVALDACPTATAAVPDNNNSPRVELLVLTPPPIKRKWAKSP
ncbi:MAG: hypothetical protein ACT4NY_19005 [Pseudonocardiales bacterium]